MSDCSENRNPLVRNGTSQGQRALDKLSPTSVEILDKSTEDWMVWASLLSDHISYTSLKNTQVGTMKPFFASNVSSKLAMVASYPPEILAQSIRELLFYIETEDTLLEEKFSYLFDIILSYFSIIDALVKATVTDKEYHTLLLNHIRAKLVPLTNRTFSYYKTALLEVPLPKLVVDSNGLDLHIFLQPVTAHQELVASNLNGLAAFWYPNAPDFGTYFSSIPEDDTIFGGMISIGDRIKYVAQHNFFTSILDQLVASSTFVTQLSKKYIDKYLTDWPHHEPNYALYLSWLQLLKGTKAHLNELTGRHLDFYYKQVLQLKPLAQQPDSAFLAMELNKVTASYVLKDNTVFMGPKDENGDTITYESIRETVLNKAKIKHLLGLYYGGVDDDIASEMNNRRLFAAPIINSADGMGVEFSDDVISWHPFHIKTYANGELASINMPKAEVGFAIASHYLRLKEGLREIVMTLTLSKAITLGETDYKAYITVEKEWLALDTSTTQTANGALNTMRFTFTIPGDEDPIVAYNPEVHMGSLTATEPVLKIILEHKDTSSFLYDTLSGALVYNVDLKVGAGEINNVYNENGIKSLELHNDASPLNPSKPFHPWGPEPTIGNSFIIGSDEIFYKEGAKIQLNFKWKDYPLSSTGSVALGSIDFDNYSTVPYNSFNSVNVPESIPNVKIHKLSKNKWELLSNEENVFISPVTSQVSEEVAFKIDLSQATEKEVFLSKEKPWQTYGANSSNGFIKVSLINDFGHRDYYNALINFSKNETATNAPRYPYKPTLASFSIGYEASSSLDLTDPDKTIFAQRPLEFFHIGPFGDSEQHRVLQHATPRLVSKLIVKTEGSFKAQGSLFIGLENLLPGDTQSMLFQLQEGSEDPLLEKPEPHLKWQYLKAHTIWEDLPDDNVGDNTSGLIESGLINFIIPKDAALEHTAFESNLIWIRCYVTEAPNAVAKVIGIYPNAIRVERIIPDQTEYDTMTTSAGEIKKLLIPDAKVKKVEQPYTSFNGKPREPDEAFYIRASERLRHKDRAITIWDYERLVLQAFPEIYKAKCLNHTKIGGSLSEGNLVYNEVAPGHVSVITIPNLANRNDIDPLKPYTKKSTLKDIENFLAERSSCQVQIHTAQPDFEEVKVKCLITLRDAFPDTNYYKEVIQKDILNFLSPWAFTADTDLNFGGRVHQSVLIDFIEELPYVDFLTDFELIHIKSNGEVVKVDEVIASTGRSILVSVPAIKHDLTVQLKAPETILEVDCTDE
ncbi:baseplate J/gp47 family protein [Pareuzebyella sediminis]|uniref:hypothetical protein n=1 Tax=Pareuzebyella sediminis TaxID=2607998 RepID=UPI0018E1739F|nr:hypothetical protein [Pareuzebyella sediminis]